VQGLRDPQLGAALAAIHAEPERPWSVDSLAAKAGLSRSVFAERFGERIGRTPMSYLAAWRLQIAARRLRETNLSISEILHGLGYGSAASFDRAFKRAHQLSPSAYRRRFAQQPPRLAPAPASTG
jgi:transcriptional regulator GlxA family with amidase domain